MIIKIKDKFDVELKDGLSALDLAQQLNIKNPNQAIAVKINNNTCDLNTVLKNDDTVEFVDFEDKDGEIIFWHTSAHVLAQAVLRLYPEAIPTIGPATEDGFYYDFANLNIGSEDLKKIEKEMQTIVSENLKTTRKIFTTKEDAKTFFKNNKYKCEIIDNLPDGEPVSYYQQGEFHDLCQGPHIHSLGKIKALKLLKNSGSYWRGDIQNDVLTRIYGITFPDKKSLKDYLYRLEEAKKRDHKVIGPKLGLFSIHNEAPGMPIIHPNGMIVWEHLISFMRECHKKGGYSEIKTPVLMTKELWETSGHWSHYRENMYTSVIEEREFAIKPMNCPGCLVYYRSQLHSYRELPLRIAEFGNVHRNEGSGSISGLLRVRSFHQDDAHIFLEMHDIEKEIVSVLNLVNKIYSSFGLEYHLELSTKPEKNTIGSDEDWNKSTEGLKTALKTFGRDFIINEGDGAFYGPKIDIHIKDALGRTWQCGTIQVDMSLPEKFNLEYTAKDGSRKRPVMIHRAIYGSMERFFAILIEHFAGRFPLWISPHQVRIIAIADRHMDFAEICCETIKSAGFICDIDGSHESVSKKIREAQLNQINYILTIGDREIENKTVTLRTRDNVIIGEIEVNDFIKKISIENNDKSLTSIYKEERLQ